MVKRRVPYSVEKKIEQFASAVDKTTECQEYIDSEAPRAYKAIRVPFNQYEYDLLERLCKKTKRSKLNMIRYALKYYDENDV